ncbi:MAG: S-methyl-5-thioribose-1-phosphate isomerase, partial [Candidatus Heimdallarchaeota archaeon]
MKIKSLELEDVRSVEWNEESNSLQLIDQRLIPFRISFVQLSSVEEISSAIKQMVVRGAPAIGATAAYGVVQAIKEIKHESYNNKKEKLESKLEILLKSRPTAVD